MGSIIDRDRLVKLLGMIGSDHDNEALQSARRAHEIVQRSGRTWDDVIHTEAEPKELELMFHELDRRIDRLRPSDQRLFLQARYSFFKNKLENDQVKMLRHFYNLHITSRSSDEEEIPF